MIIKSGLLFWVTLYTAIMRRALVSLIKETRSCSLSQDSDKNSQTFKFLNMLSLITEKKDFSSYDIVTV